MTLTFLMCTECEATTVDTNDFLDDITRDGSDCCGAPTAIYVGAHARNEQEEIELTQLLTEWENKHKKSFGGVAERFKAVVLKTIDATAPKGSNPFPSANLFEGTVMNYKVVPFLLKRKGIMYSVYSNKVEPLCEMIWAMEIPSSTANPLGIIGFILKCEEKYVYVMNSSITINEVKVE